MTLALSAALVGLPESASAELSDGTKYQLNLGSKTPVQSGTYAKRADTADVFVIDHAEKPSEN